MPASALNKDAAARPTESAQLGCLALRASTHTLPGPGPVTMFLCRSITPANNICFFGSSG